MEESGEGGAPACKKRRIEEVDSAEVTSTDLAAQKSFDDLLEGDDWEADDDDDDDGMLPDARDRAAELILSPVKPPLGVEGRKQSTPRKSGKSVNVAANDEDDAQMLDAEANDEDDAYQAKIAAHEAEVAARYGLSLANWKHLQDSRPAEPTTPGGFQSDASFAAAAGFTSGRGSKLAPPSEASLLRARELHQSPEHAEDANEGCSSVVKGDGQGKADDSGFAETPSFSRISKAGSSRQITSISRPPSNKGFKPPASVPRNPAGKLPLPGDGGVQIRLGPKNGNGLLSTRLVNVQTALESEGSLGDTPSKGTPKANAAFEGFTSGSGAKVAMPSKEEANARMERMESGDKSAQIVKSAVPAFAGLTSGSGKAVAGPSAEAIAKVTARLASAADPDSVSDGVMEESPLPEKATVLGGLTTGSGKAVAGPSAESIAKIAARLDGPAKDPIAANEGASAFTTGGGSSVAMPSKAAVEKAVADLDARSTTPAGPPSALLDQDMDNDDVPTFAPASQCGPAIYRTPAAEKSLKKPFTPLRPGVTSTPSRAMSIGSPRFGPNGTPQVSLSMQQRNTQSGASNRKAFKVPFKGGVKPTAEDLSKFASQSKAKTLEPGTMVGTAPKDVLLDLTKEKEKERALEVKRPAKQLQKRAPVRGKDSVFDLYTPVERLSMQDYGLDPGWTTKTLVEADFPKDLLWLNYEQCEGYKFHGEFGHQEAFDELSEYGGCKGIKLDWIKNHYGLIIWKCLSIARAKPAEWADWMNFEKVCDQLKYRYEREVLLSQRSCIKRIQERDSSPAIPMCLVVTRILQEEREMQPEMGSEAYERGETVKELWPSQLELTDGWYKIKANLDPVLEQAVLMENLVSGTKMLIQGAKLEGGGEGEEPLAAFESSTLGICGNSTVRASWDTKLGFRKGRAICSFKSLRPDGGNVPFIDVVVATMYPMGYKGPFVEGEPQDVWNEDEETERQKVYEKQRERAVHTVQAEYNKRGEHLKAIHQVLRTAAHTSRKTAAKAEPVPGLSDCADVFTKLDEDVAKGKTVIRALSKELLDESLEYATRHLESYQNDAFETMRKDLEDLCPPRVAKPFRIIRVKDYHDRDPDVNRTCLLNIIDPSKLEAGFLAEDKRYIISNLTPGRINSWARRDIKDGELYLNTRYDSKWQSMPM